MLVAKTEFFLGDGGLAGFTAFHGFGGVAIFPLFLHCVCVFLPSIRKGGLRGEKHNGLGESFCNNKACRERALILSKDGVPEVSGVGISRPSKRRKQSSRSSEICWCRLLLLLHPISSSICGPRGMGKRPTWRFIRRWI